jgi:hypothetical protein
MKIIITESQQESLKNKLQQIVKKSGWGKASKAVGSTDNLLKIGFDNNPMNFLNLFNDLDVIQSEENPDWILYRYEKGSNMMVYDRKKGHVKINEKIWESLEDVFGLKYIQVKELTQDWLGDTYNLRGFRTFPVEYGNSMSVE